MSSRRRPRIDELEWDDRNERHVEEHVGAWQVEDLIEGGDWFAFRNYRGHPPEHRLLIGRTRTGAVAIDPVPAPS